ncbi:dynamin family protein [Gemmata sp. JC673]|uniref:Dynamin family protein n=1 Tax=Gemmata algarum TaxID=2975278 RepID=A0ABU5FD99_9BACT|nr:dynamin family protein [Gemmata algarum]MDY3563786.1 dynamin family protein [Gemmata algarum]
MSDLQERMDQLRLGVLTAVDGLLARAAEYQLGSPPDALAVCRRRLDSNAYQVLVVGEVKRGKSSFINALIGQKILPTDVDVATSQVFRVSRAAQEAYRLRFEDGSEKSVDRKDLPLYGSQVVADAGGTPGLNQIIRWLEVDVPVRFLPPGVSILDTPGLGGLYELHAEITHRFIPEADSVVFVLDSSRPIIEAELEYLETILGATRNVFFIQTKFDLFRGKEWQGVRARNQEILRERFGDRLLDARVWPISSQLLTASVTKGDEDFEIASKHRELAPALKSFLFRAAGWTRAAELLILATEFHAYGVRLLEERHKTLVSESKQKRDAFQRQLAERKDTFLNDWGDRGRKRRELREGVKRLASLGKAQISQFLSRGGELETLLQNSITAADSPEALRAVADRISSDAGARAMRAWREISGRSWSQCLQLLAPLLKDAEDVTAPDRGAPVEGLPAGGASPQIARDWYSKIKSARFDFATGLWAGGLTGSVGGGLLVALGAISLPLVAPLAAAAGFIAAVWATVRGNKTANLNQLKAAKQEVARHVTEVCQKTRQHFLEVNMAAGTFGPVDEYFSELERIAEDQVERLTRTKAADTEAEIARLKREAELSEQDRKAEAERVRLKMMAWKTAGQGLNELAEKLKALDQAAGGAQQPPPPPGANPA